MNKCSIFVLLIVLFCACSTTKVLYQTPIKSRFQKVGMCQVASKQNAFTMVTEETKAHFNENVRYVKSFIAKEAVTIETNLDFDLPDTAQIQSICATNGLDGLLLSKIVFRDAENVSEIPLVVVSVVTTDRYYECKLFTKLYNAKAQMQYYIAHDSKEDDYEKKPPTTNDIVATCVKNTCIRIGQLNSSK
jgi:hypothetical protein